MITTAMTTMSKKKCSDNGSETVRNNPKNIKNYAQSVQKDFEKVCRKTCFLYGFGWIWDRFGVNWDCFGTILRTLCSHLGLFQSSSGCIPQNQNRFRLVTTGSVPKRFGFRFPVRFRCSLINEPGVHRTDVFVPPFELDFFNLSF